MACRLIEKAYLQGQTTLVWCHDEEAVKKLDDLLWIFKEDSFIPHTTEIDSTPTAVHLIFQEENFINKDILINLRSELPQKTNLFARIIQIVNTLDNEAKKLGRNLYKQYALNSFQLKIHHLD